MPKTRQPASSPKASPKTYFLQVTIPDGQSAAAHGVTKADLLPGVQMSLSAMTSHALLQQQGYALNPF